MFETPVLFLIFNRIETTKKVFEAIREIRPKYFYIAADGPRNGKPDDITKCIDVRNYVINNIDWDCEVKTLFREENLGCGVAPSLAISWFFENIDMGIILEDDCLPNKSFFKFCDTLLNYYKGEERIMHINGSNFQNGKLRGEASYFFSYYSPVWGWATWKRAWNKYDFELKNIEFNSLNNIFKNIKFNNREIKFWENIFLTVKGGERKDIWDLQWAFTIWQNNGFSISPNKNLISNIGFGNDATHTVQTDSNVSNLPTQDLLSIIHPQNLDINFKADLYTFNHHVFPPANCISIIKGRLINLLKRVL